MSFFFSLEVLKFSKCGERYNGERCKVYQRKMSDFQGHIKQSKSQKMPNKQGRDWKQADMSHPPTAACHGTPSGDGPVPPIRVPEAGPLWSYMCNESDFPPLPKGIGPAPNGRPYWTREPAQVGRADEEVRGAQVNPEVRKG